MRDLGFIKMSQVVKLDQPPYKFRDGIIKPTKLNPSSGVYAMPVKVGLLPKTKARIRVDGKFVTPLSKNSVLVTSNGTQVGWHPDPHRDNKERPHIVGSSSGKNYHAWIEFDSIIVYKKPEHVFKISSENYRDDISVEVIRK